MSGDKIALSTRGERQAQRKKADSDGIDDLV